MQRIHSMADVAEVLQVSRPAIANAVKRGNGTPAPAYVTGQGRTYWDDEGLADWRVWQLESARRGNSYLR